MRSSASSRRRTRTNTTVSIDVQSLSVGAQSANAFTGWTSPATTVFSMTNYGVTSKYISVADHTYAIAKTKGVSRDQEITSWMNKGAMYVRWTPGGKGIGFYYNANTNSYILRIFSGLTEGLSTGAPDNVGVGATGVLRDYTLPSIGSISGYSNSATAGHTWTLGVEGFDIYLKYNGTEFFRVTSFYVIEPGIMGIASNDLEAEFGHRNVTATHKTNVAGFSSLGDKIIDIRDLGAKSLSTTGSMTAASTTLTVASNPGFSIGDQIVVAVGGEAGGGVPGERGVGGQWPTLTYANNAARDADTSQVVNKVCGVLASGDTFSWNGSAWVSYSGSQDRYLGQILPVALVATITNISGTTFTLDTAATVSTTSAAVYFDSAFIIETLDSENSGIRSQSGCTISFPTGEWVLANETLIVSLVDGVSVIGEGMDSTTILCPPGLYESSIYVTQCDGATVGNMEIVGNTLVTGGYLLPTNATTDAYSGAVTFVTLEQCASSRIENLRGKNYSNAVSVISQSDNCVQSNIEVVHDTGHSQYFQWAVNIADSDNCVSEDITFDCPALFKALESFRSTGSILRRATGTNALMSSNTSFDLLIEDCNITYEAGAGDLNGQLAYSAVDKYPSPLEPLINLNSNIGGASSGNITMTNNDFIVEGRLWTGSGVFVITADGSVDNVTINGKYQAKPVTSPSGLITIPGLGSDVVRAIRQDSNSATITIDGVRATGTYTQTPFGNFGGSVPTLMTITDCVADNIGSGGTQSGNISNATYNAL